tara:strand:- start:1277 stop:1453 length:177 start_codon:yes stop_codon:yes gene_type:complete
MAIEIDGFWYWLQEGVLMRSLRFHVKYHTAKRHGRAVHNPDDYQLRILNLLIERINDD